MRDKRACSRKFLGEMEAFGDQEAAMTDHDAGYRSLFSDKEMMVELLRGFVKEPWVDDLDFETLEPVNASFVAEKFKKRESDVIWRVRFRTQWLYVYVLIEFQSTVDWFMALRLLVLCGAFVPEPD